MNQSAPLISLVPANAPILRTAAQPVVLVDDAKAYKQPMLDLILGQRGLGLAAPQIGVPFAFFVTRFPEFPFCANPSFTPAPTCGRTSAQEGCLTWPGRFTYVARWNMIQAVWTDEKGHQRGAIMTGIHARVFQHETDHLNGMCIF